MAISIPTPLGIIVIVLLNHDNRPKPQQPSLRKKSQHVLHALMLRLADYATCQRRTGPSRPTRSYHLLTSYTRFMASGVGKSAVVSGRTCPLTNWAAPLRGTSKGVFPQLSGEISIRSQDGSLATGEGADPYIPELDSGRDTEGMVAWEGLKDTMPLV